MPSKPLRILYDNSLSSNPAGTGVFVRGLLAGLQRLPEVEVICAAPTPAAASQLDVAGKRLGGRLRQGLRHLRYYASTLPAQAHAADCRVILCPSTLGPLRGRTPTVITLFDLSPLRFPGTLDWLSRLYLRGMFARGVRRAASVCTISQAVATELVARYRLAPDRVHVAYPGPDSELLHAVPQPAITAGRRFVLMVGTLEPRKNHLTVLHALADHVRRRPDSPLTLVLAGSPGWHYRPVLEAIDALELTGRVERLGAVDAPRLKWLYQEAQALLFPSLYEGFGLPVLEAFALKCPVLAADIPAVRELAGPAAALLLPPTDLQAWAAALDRVADRGRDEARLTAAAERAGRFTWEACARGALAAARQAGAV